MQGTWVQILGQEEPLEKEMATHSSTLTWEIPWTEEPGRLVHGVAESDTTLQAGISEVKASACSAGDLDSIPVLGRAPGEGNGNPLQYSCLENPTDGGAWWAAVHGVTKSRTRLSDFTFTFFNFSWFHVRMIAPDF